MEWQAVVLAIQILLLAVGWILFQRARGELSARAAETPVLGEVKALHKSIKQLLTELENRADQKADRLEKCCEEANALLAALNRQREQAEYDGNSGGPNGRPRRGPADTQGADPAEARRSQSRPARRKPAESAASLPETEEAIVSAGLAVAASRQVPASPPEQNAQSERRHRVFALADAGESAGAIARATQLSEGEVETLLGLRGQRR